MVFLDKIDKNSEFDTTKALKIQNGYTKDVQILVDQLDACEKKVEKSFKKLCIDLCNKLKNCGLVQYNVEKELENNTLLIDKLLKNLHEEVSIIKIIPEFEESYKQATRELD